jgi:hypothetical protein
MSARLGRAPTAEEIAAVIGIEPEEVDSLKRFQAPSLPTEPVVEPALPRTLMGSAAAGDNAAIASRFAGSAPRRSTRSCSWHWVLGRDGLRLGQVRGDQALHRRRGVLSCPQVGGSRYCAPPVLVSYSAGPVASVAWDGGELLRGRDRTDSRSLPGAVGACVAVGGGVPGG